MTSRRSFLQAAGVVGGAAAIGPAVAGGTASAATAPGARGGIGTPLPFRSGTPVDRLPHPLVIGHRGAPGYRPEHTTGSYDLAVEVGADVIEAGDLVITKDGELIIRHENDISQTTDVAQHPEFAARRTTKTVDGTAVTGWFTEDFTLAEIKTLRAIERLPLQRQHNTIYDRRWEVLTFQEGIDLAARARRTTGRNIYIHVETKHPTYFRGIGLPLEPRVAQVLRRNGLGGRNAPVFLQSFEPSSLQRLAKLVDPPRIQLLDVPTSRPYDFVKAGDPRTVADLITPTGLRFIASFADGIGPVWTNIVPLDSSGATLPATGLVRHAHDARLWVHPYTVRPENFFLPTNLQTGSDPNDYGNVFELYRRLWEQDIDGLFTDTPDIGFAARADYWRSVGVGAVAGRPAH